MGRTEMTGALGARWMAIVVVLLGGCYQSYAQFGDGLRGEDARAEVDAEVEADAADEVDAVEEVDGVPDDVADDVPVEVDGSTCPDWFDPTSGLCWQDPPDGTTRTWDDAMAYCDGLDVAGHDDWHLPTISELRSLVRGCPATEAGGSCAVTDTCLGDECWSTACEGCPFERGPGAGGAYWSPELGDPWMMWFWSSTTAVGGSSAWFVVSAYGRVSDVAKTVSNYVRCVRPER